MNTQRKTQPATARQRPAVNRQYQDVRQYQDAMGRSARATGHVAGTWQHLADLLDELLMRYDEHLEPGQRSESYRAAAGMHGDVRDGVDVAAAVARENAQILDDLATEITIAHARMRTIWNEMERDRAGTTPPDGAALERRYSARVAREAWYPLDGDVMAARDRLQIVPGER